MSEVWGVCNMMHEPLVAAQIALTGAPEWEPAKASPRRKPWERMCHTTAKPSKRAYQHVRSRLPNSTACVAPFGGLRVGSTTSRSPELASLRSGLLLNRPLRGRRRRVHHGRKSSRRQTGGDIRQFRQATFWLPETAKPFGTAERPATLTPAAGVPVFVDGSTNRPASSVTLSRRPTATGALTS